MNKEKSQHNQAHDSTVTQSQFQELLERVDRLEQENQELQERTDSLEQENRQLEERVESLEQELEEQSQQFECLTDELSDHQEHTGNTRAKLSGRINTLEQQQQSQDETRSANTTETEPTIPQDELTPIEQISRVEDVSDVTSSPSVKRAVSLFANLDDWGSRTPKGIVLKSSDKPLKLLCADRDEDLCWKQYYRACETLESLSEGAVTFFNSNKHGKMLVLHEHSELYSRMKNGVQTVSSVAGTV